jgi:hypothetical protein
VEGSGRGLYCVPGGIEEHQEDLKAEWPISGLEINSGASQVRTNRSSSTLGLSMMILCKPTFLVPEKYKHRYLVRLRDCN